LDRLLRPHDLQRQPTRRRSRTRSSTAARKQSREHRADQYARD
jgi:hypothetical protein